MRGIYRGSSTVERTTTTKALSDYFSSPMEVQILPLILMKTQKSIDRTARRKARRLAKSPKRKGNSGGEPEARKAAALVAEKLHLERKKKDPFYNIALI